MKCIVGKKMNMSQIFNEDGTVIPVTGVSVSECVVTQIKTLEKDGYVAVQLGTGKKRHINKPERGHLDRVSKDVDCLRKLVEFRVDDVNGIEEGAKINASVFTNGDVVNVTGISKGRGFQGVVKRHGFHGSPASHGHKDQLRMPGSIGATDAAHVFKGMRMAGRMGSDQVTVTNLKIVAVDSEKNILFIKGAIPGCIGSWLKICER